MRRMFRSRRCRTREPIQLRPSVLVPLPPNRSRFVRLVRSFSGTFGGPICWHDDFHSLAAAQTGTGVLLSRCYPKNGAFGLHPEYSWATIAVEIDDVRCATMSATDRDARFVSLDPVLMSYASGRFTGEESSWRRTSTSPTANASRSSSSPGDDEARYPGGPCLGSSTCRVNPPDSGGS